MKAGFVIILFFFVSSSYLNAQRNCTTNLYAQEAFSKDAAIKRNFNAVESFIARQLLSNRNEYSTEAAVIKIPVVVHILYHTQDQKLTDAQINNQINILNECFRKKNADTVNIPARFKSLATDCEIEFQLATSDSRKRYTTGINRQYTPITEWKAGDDMKYTSRMGADAWDTKSYLNIWVCKLDNVAGYSSVIGGPAEVDGIVLDFPAFGVNNSSNGYNLGKTAVHEVGHWLGLKHLWGEEYCGDDGVGDTPKQAGFNVECPSGISISCSNGPDGDMYMNYMDYTSDACINMFTHGQKARIKALFNPGGIRNSLLSSKGLDAPLIFESPLPDEDPKWLESKLYPNPATNELTLDLAYDIRWIGKIIQITNLHGQILMNVVVTSRLVRIDISKLPTGIYFLAAKKDDGESMKKRFIKL